MKKIIYIAIVLLLFWLALNADWILFPKSVHKTMDKSTEKVLMNPHGIEMDSGDVYVKYSIPLYTYDLDVDSTDWATKKFNYISFDTATNIISFKQDTVFIHDTVYLKSKSKILDESMCDTCPKIEIPLIDKH